MLCIHLKFRTKKYKRIIYCKKNKKEIVFDNCSNCDYKEYKKTKPIKGKKHRSTKATEIPIKIKKVVWERDNHRCIFCNKVVPLFNANAHFIPRSALGLGIEKNVFTACENCHSEQDNGKDSKLYTLKAENYLKGVYGANWDKSKLIYKKYKRREEF